MGTISVGWKGGRRAFGVQALEALGLAALLAGGPAGLRGVALADALAGPTAQPGAQPGETPGETLLPLPAGAAPFDSAGRHDLALDLLTFFVRQQALFPGRGVYLLPA